VKLTQELSKPGCLCHTGAGDRVAAWTTRRRGCPPGTQHTQKWSSDCPDSQPSQRRCRQLAQQRSGGELGRSQPCLERSEGGALTQQGVTPAGHACEDRSVERHM
jgi:hypothetical protein